MKVSKLLCYSQNPDAGVNNEYPTPVESFKQPALHMIVGQRTAGKSYLTSKILAQAKKDKTFDRIYIVTPSFNSNKSYFGKYIDEEDVYEPTKESISDVIKSVESDRDEFENYLNKMKMYKQFQKDKHKNSKLIDEDNLIYYYENNFFNEIPTWKYQKVEPPKSLLILDDCLGSPAILQSSGLTKIATLNRHVAALKENHSNRSACGLAVIILTQSYRMNNGISRVLRENLSLLTLFKNKQQKQLDAIKEELANVVDEEKFGKAYEFATGEKFGSLTVDFVPKDQKFQFRKNLNELIILD
jgi:hypothetical protein